MRLVIFIFAAIMAAVALSQQPQTAPDANASASLDGFVVDVASGNTMPHTGLRLIADDGYVNHQYEAESDDAGGFRFGGVAPGRYRLLAERPGYLPAYGSHVNTTNGLPVGISAGSETKGVLVRMTVAAVIKGRVVDQNGEPVSGGVVQALSDTMLHGRRRWSAAGASLTDDHGEFRIHSLFPGRYWAIAMRARTRHDLRAASAQPEKQLYVPTYFPSATDRQMSIPLDLRGGEEAPIQITLQKAATVHVRGKVVIGRIPARGGEVNFSQAGVSLNMPSASVRTDDVGNFETRLVPGTYRATSSVTGPSGTASGRPTVRIGPEGAEDVLLNLNANTALTLSVDYRARNPLRTPFPAVSVSLVPLTADDDIDASSGPIFGRHDPRNGRYFNFPDVPAGSFDVVINGPGDAFVDAYVESTSVADGGEPGVITLRGESRRTVRAVINLDGAEISGVVVTPKDVPLRGATVVAVPDRDRRLRPSQYKIAYTDSAGKFTLHGLPPGDYTLVGWNEVEDEMWLNPQFDPVSERDTVKISVTAADRQQVPLRAIMTTPE